MDAKVIVPFWDMQDPARKTYYAGDVFSGTAARIKELAEKGHVEPIKEAKPSKEKPVEDAPVEEAVVEQPEEKEAEPAPKRAARRSK